MKGITKAFPGVIALDHINFSAEKGEVHAIAGENGAGKSTLIKILSGAYTADEGEIWLDGKQVTINSPSHGRKQGIMVIYQELSLVPTTSIAENIFLGNLINKGGFIDRKEMNRRAHEALEEIGFGHLDPNRLVGTLSVAEQQAVEISKIIVENAKIVVMDEPTALLPPQEVETLFRIIDKLKSKGITVIYISHRLQEVLQKCDRVSVFKDGKSVGTVSTEGLHEHELVTMMIGREVSNADLWSPERTQMLADAPVIFEAKELQYNDGLGAGVNLQLRKGEILGIAGLVGCGKSLLAQAMFGAVTPTGGCVEMGGKKLEKLQPTRSIANGVGYLTADRKRTGLILNQSLRTNISLAGLHLLNRCGFISFGKEKQETARMSESLHIKCHSLEQPANTLSGGNQQKVVMAKWLLLNCDVLIFDEPTRGVDVGARREIYKLILDYVASGGSTILVSSDSTELLSICDRILVMAQGQIVASLSHEEATEDKIVQAMF